MYKTLFYLVIITLFSSNAMSQEKDSLKSNEYWKGKLSEMEYHVAREKGTERPFTGKYWNFFEKGTYSCVCCGTVLFESDSKFASSCGWPSFFDSKYKDNLEFHEDKSYNMIRTEVLCKKCGAHLGHIFDDGPKPT